MLDPPKAVAFSEAFTSYRDAFQREQQVKRWSRAKKEALTVGGILEASDGERVTLMDQMGGGEVDTFTAPRRIEILDERWPDKIQGWELVFVKDVDGNRFGAIYADQLQALYKAGGPTAPSKSEDLPEQEEPPPLAPVTAKVNMEDVLEAFQRIKDAFEQYGPNIVNMMIDANFISEKDLRLALSGEGAEERAEYIIDETSDNLSVEDFIRIFGPKH